MSTLLDILEVLTPLPTIRRRLSEGPVGPRLVLATHRGR